MGKRGQITFFIIIGVFIAFLVGFGMYFASSQQAEEIPPTQVVMGNLDESVFKEFLTSCLMRAGESGIWLMGLQGGYLSRNQANLYNSVPYGKGQRHKFYVPIYGNAGDHVCLVHKGENSDEEEVFGCSDDLPDVVGIPELVDITFGPNIPYIRHLRKLTDEGNGDPNSITYVDPQTINELQWSGLALPSLEAIEAQWARYTLFLFEECLDEGLSEFATYVDIRKPTDFESYNESRDAYLDAITITDFSYPSLGEPALEYTTDRVTLSMALNDNDARINLNYPLRVTDAKRTLSVSQINVVHDVAVKRLHNAARIFVEKALEHNKRELTNLDAPENVYNLTDAECGKYEGLAPQGHSLLPLNGKTNIYVSDMLDEREVLEELEGADCPFGELGCTDFDTVLDLALSASESEFREYQLVRFVDYRPKEIKYNTPFVFQFAIKNLNVRGSCPGE